MSKKGLGMTTVLDDSDKLAGIVTDGDLRRLMQSKKGATLELTAEQAMTRNPVMINAHELASTALSLMEQRKITSVVVVDDSQRVRGVLHLHDLWTLELY
jgi:arabinose-5-phosphate isomerase